MTAVMYALLADAALPPDYFFGSGDTDYLAMMLLYFFVIAPAIVALGVVLTVVYNKRRRIAEHEE